MGKAGQRGVRGCPPAAKSTSQWLRQALGLPQLSRAAPESAKHKRIPSNMLG